jgi:hypothetical protein
MQTEHSKCQPMEHRRKRLLLKRAWMIRSIANVLYRWTNVQNLYTLKTTDRPPVVSIATGGS